MSILPAYQRLGLKGLTYPLLSLDRVLVPPSDAPADADAATTNAAATHIAVMPALMRAPSKPRRLRRPAGLAVGLAPKEQRYGRVRPIGPWGGFRHRPCGSPAPLRSVRRGFGRSIERRQYSCGGGGLRRAACPTALPDAPIGWVVRESRGRRQPLPVRPARRPGTARARRRTIPAARRPGS